MAQSAIAQGQSVPGRRHIPSVIRLHDNVFDVSFFCIYIVFKLFYLKDIRLYPCYLFFQLFSTDISSKALGDREGQSICPSLSDLN